jgi:hypothetical protein
VAVQSKVGSFSTGTAAAGNTVVVTGLGFAPKVVIFWWSGRSESVTTLSSQTHRRGVGFATGSTSRHCVTSFSAHLSANADAQNSHRDDACVARIDGAGTDEGRLDVQSLDGDGFTLVVDTAFVSAMRIAYLALGGDSITAQGTELLTASTGTGTVDYTTLGFQPTFLMFIGARQSSVPATSTDSLIHTGWATGSGANANAHVMGGSDDAQATMVTKHNSRRTECIARFNSSISSITGRANLSAFLSNGYRLNWIEADPTPVMYSVLAIGGISAVVGQTTSWTDTSDHAITGVGFKPASVMFLSATDTEPAQDAVAGWDPWSMGAGDGTNMMVHNVMDIDAIATSNVQAGIDFANVYLCTTTGGGRESSMELRTLDADGFTTRMTDTEASNLWITYLAFGPEGPVAGGYEANLSLLGVGA